MLLLNAILSLVVMLFTLIRMDNLPEWKIVQGIVLSGWIGLELFMIHDPNTLELFYFLAGAMILILGILSRGKRTNQPGDN